LAALILPISSFYLWKNKKAGQEEGEKIVRVGSWLFFFFFRG
jgi:hypothetical protein